MPIKVFTEKTEKQLKPVELSFVNGSLIGNEPAIDIQLVDSQTGEFVEILGFITKDKILTYDGVKEACNKKGYEYPFTVDSEKLVCGVHIP